MKRTVCGIILALLCLLTACAPAAPVEETSADRAAIGSPAATGPSGTPAPTMAAPAPVDAPVGRGLAPAASEQAGRRSGDEASLVQREGDRACAVEGSTEDRQPAIPQPASPTAPFTQGGLESSAPTEPAAPGAPAPAEAPVGAAISRPPLAEQAGRRSGDEASPVQGEGDRACAVEGLTEDCQPAIPQSASLTAPFTQGGLEPAAPTCTVSITCETLAADPSRCDPAKAALIPADGILLAPTALELREGETAFDLLLRACRQNGIHLEFSETPLYDSAYIEGIGNLYEFDAGELSGWMFSVNGVFPNYGCSQYTLQPGDTVCWRYTCDLGRDIGGQGMGGAGT